MGCILGLAPKSGARMPAAADPFSHHPELRDRIADPLTSPSRSLTTAKLATLMQSRGLPADWWYADSVREAERGDTLAARRDTDLWVFGYGSLMWDPGVRFEEVRRAHLPGYARRFILKDIYGGRGTVDAPGLMVALDKGSGCDGLAFRISRANLDEETEVLWRRERIGPAYMPVFVHAGVRRSRRSDHPLDGAHLRGRPRGNPDRCQPKPHSADRVLRDRHRVHGLESGLSQKHRPALRGAWH